MTTYTPKHQLITKRPDDQTHHFICPRVRVLRLFKIDSVCDFLMSLHKATSEKGPTLDGMALLPVERFLAVFFPCKIASDPPTENEFTRIFSTIYFNKKFSPTY